MLMLEHYNVETKGKNAQLSLAGAILGRPMSILLQ